MIKNEVGVKKEVKKILDRYKGSGIVTGKQIGRAHV